MNYLETGLPLSDFVRRKTDFSPPRFIPLCSLGRKYRGLESLTRREVGVLVKRLSEPKRNSLVDDSSPDITMVTIVSYFHKSIKVISLSEISCVNFVLLNVLCFFLNTCTQSCS